MVGTDSVQMTILKIKVVCFAKSSYCIGIRRQSIILHLVQDFVPIGVLPQNESLMKTTVIAFFVNKQTYIDDSEIVGLFHVRLPPRILRRIALLPFEVGNIALFNKKKEINVQ